MASQFIHIDAVSQKDRILYRHVNGKKFKYGTISVESVINEASRNLDSSFNLHIKNPLLPITVYKSDDMQNDQNVFDQLKKRIDDWYADTLDARGHKVRYDALALLSGVISWPPYKNDENYDYYINRMKAFEIDIVKWLKDTYKNDLMLIVRHDDEPFKKLNSGIHYHWHFYCVKKPNEKFDLHPGFFARSQYNITRGEKKCKSKDEIKKSYNDGVKAFNQAMKDFQDKFSIVAKKHNLNRIREGRLRRSRSEEVEVEKYIEKEINNTKNECSNIITIAKNDAQVLLDETKKISNKIKEAAISDAEEIKRNAINEARQIKENAWKVANDIDSGAKNESIKILNESKNYISYLFKLIDKIPGGKKVINNALEKWKYLTATKNIKKTNNDQGTEEKGESKKRS